MRLSRHSEPFDSDQFIYELKIDGFRALVHIQNGHGELVSRNGNGFPGFAELATWIAEHLKVESAVLGREIACLDEGGRPTFRDLIFRKRQCIFIAFELLYLNGKDLSTLPLIDRKMMLKRLIRRKRARMFYLDHVEGDGRLLFEEVVKSAVLDRSGRIGRYDSSSGDTLRPELFWNESRRSDWVGGFLGGPCGYPGMSAMVLESHETPVNTKLDACGPAWLSY
jgi:hypothetical protein